MDNPEDKPWWHPGEGVKAVGKSIVDNPAHSAIGAVVGQVVIPIPVVGAVIGGVIGGWIGKKNDPKQNEEKNG